MTPDFARQYPRLPAENMAWCEYVYAFLTEGVNGLHVGREGTLVRIRRGDCSIAMGARQSYLSVYFRHPSFAESYRRASGRAKTGKYTLNLTYLDDGDLELIRGLVRRALGWQPRLDTRPDTQLGAHPATASYPTYQLFREMFAGAVLVADDLLLLEPFQIAYLPGWVPQSELGTLLNSLPYLHRYMATACPAAGAFLDEARDLGADGPTDAELAHCEDLVLWTVADLLVYNKCPEMYDALPFHAWAFAEVTDLVDLSGETVLDCGSGTGRVALEAACRADTVYAVEPVGRLRRFIRDRADELQLGNLHVVDGFHHDLPFSDDFADVLITSHALGWHLDRELPEFERVTRPGGTIIHCPGTAQSAAEEPQHQVLTGAPWSYDWAPMDEADGPKRKYWKRP